MKVLLSAYACAPETVRHSDGLTTTERTELVLDALDMAVSQRQPAPGLVHHTGQAQDTSLAFGRRLREAGLVASMGTVGNALDNAVAESFFATLECELLARP